jgi:hypothetical protein
MGPLCLPFSHVCLTQKRWGELTYDNGNHGTGVLTMRAHLTKRGIEGNMRSVWRFERHGKVNVACDTGHVPFAVGRDAYERLPRVPRTHDLWSPYPVAPPVSVPRSVDRFAQQVDRVCVGTWDALQRWRRYAAREVGHRPDRAQLLRGLYLRGHAAQFSSLLKLGPPPAARATYERWLVNFRRRLEVERVQVVALERGDLAMAARKAALLALMKARGNAAGLRFGLLGCTSNGPTGAANVD